MDRYHFSSKFGDLLGDTYGQGTPGVKYTVTFMEVSANVTIEILFGIDRLCIVLRGCTGRLSLGKP